MISYPAAACFVSMLVLALPSRGSERLEPCEDEPGVGYHQRVDELPDAAVSGKIVARFTTVPSFTHESGVRVTLDERGSRVHHVQLVESVWASSWLPPSSSGQVDFTLTKADLPLRSESAQVPGELIEVVLDLIRKEIRRSTTSDMMRFDGTSYFFRLGSEFCAQTWSPEPGSRASKLVALANGLGSLAHASTVETRQRVESAMRTLISELTSHIRSSGLRRQSST